MPSATTPEELAAHKAAEVLGILPKTRSPKRGRPPKGAAPEEEVAKAQRRATDILKRHASKTRGRPTQYGVSKTNIAESIGIQKSGGYFIFQSGRKKRVENAKKAGEILSKTPLEKDTRGRKPVLAPKAHIAEALGTSHDTITHAQQRVLSSGVEDKPKPRGHKPTYGAPKDAIAESPAASGWWRTRAKQRRFWPGAG
jgi:hypothetical protein